MGVACGRGKLQLLFPTFSARLRWKRLDHWERWENWENWESVHHPVCVYLCVSVYAFGPPPPRCPADLSALARPPLAAPLTAWQQPRPAAGGRSRRRDGGEQLKEPPRFKALFFLHLGNFLEFFFFLFGSNEARAAGGDRAQLTSLTGDRKVRSARKERAGRHGRSAGPRGPTPGLLRAAAAPPPPAAAAAAGLVQGGGR